MRPKCLILDDSRLVLGIARALMEARGFEVFCAADARDALALVRAETPELLLVDWYMPDMDGPDFIALVRAEPLVNQPKILLFSTETRLGAIRAALRRGANSYLMKPFDRERLDHRLRRFGFA